MTKILLVALCVFSLGCSRESKENDCINNVQKAYCPQINGFGGRDCNKPIVSIEVYTKAIEECRNRK